MICNVCVSFMWKIAQDESASFDLNFDAFHYFTIYPPHAANVAISLGLWSCDLDPNDDLSLLPVMHMAMNGPASIFLPFILSYL